MRGQRNIRTVKVRIYKIKKYEKYNAWEKTRIKHNSTHSLKASVNLGEYGRDGTVLMRFLVKTGTDRIGLHQEAVQRWIFVIT